MTDLDAILERAEFLRTVEAAYDKWLAQEDESDADNDDG